ncbi:Ref family recombination enhancement nuclease [Stutzerimonas sp. KH-1]|jgi:hypothetical protein
MKGKNPTKAQSDYHDLLAQNIGCIACFRDTAGHQRNFVVSIHHCDGRTKPDAHWQVLPLCAGHHQDGYGAPGLIAVHPYKARFELAYGKQETLIRDCALQLLDMGLAVPARVMELIGLEQAA